MAVCDGCAERVLRLAHVFTLVLGEHLDNHQRALPSPHVDVDLEVLAGSDRLTVEVPGHGRRRDAAEEHPQDGPVSIGHRLVPQRHREPRRLLFHFLVHLILHRRRRHSGWDGSRRRCRWSSRTHRLLELDRDLVLLLARRRLDLRSRYRRHWLFTQR